jgi:hypothetical protein
MIIIVMQAQFLRVNLVGAEQNLNKAEFGIELVSNLRPALERYVRPNDHGVNL